jgi:hypothetical protein
VIVDTSQLLNGLRLAARGAEEGVQQLRLVLGFPKGWITHGLCSRLGVKNIRLIAIAVDDHYVPLRRCSLELRSHLWRAQTSAALDVQVGRDFQPAALRALARSASVSEFHHSIPAISSAVGRLSGSI